VGLVGSPFAGFANKLKDNPENRSPAKSMVFGK
jgi:hypothetical protein